ncbi:MAG: putative inorganic carbon transporter subunit DabA, partial [Aureliella sp.]
MNSGTSTTAFERSSGSESQHGTSALDPSTADSLRRAIEHASHLLPTQGPITVFVHHNTLHAFEDHMFEEAVLAGGALYDCEPYLTENRFRSELESGRIGVADLQAVLLEDLADGAEILVATFGTRYALRLAMLQFPLRSAPIAELQWLMAETHALDRFREEMEPVNRQQMVAATRKWVQRDLLSSPTKHNQQVRPILHEVLKQCSGLRSVERWSEAEWESFTLRFLWRICYDGVATARRSSKRPAVSAAPYLSF